MHGSSIYIHSIGLTDLSRVMVVVGFSCALQPHWPCSHFRRALKITLLRAEIKTKNKKPRQAQSQCGCLYSLGCIPKAQLQWGCRSVTARLLRASSKICTAWDRLRKLSISRVMIDLTSSFLRDDDSRGRSLSLFLPRWFSDGYRVTRLHICNRCRFVGAADAVCVGTFRR